eukprot:CAMPEP_0197287672 /NCGR_PEP_ID=MMETSP0890-20130614/4293_1 /TAXON_ID=44058 ORGANISM="Aureoumbra lagunensis, Strain CCMP1510" /NCGR_SAMPLE_ID=MMETSP0890 /ASSEMBLY_ACC=CAM_ASM_000533 /LENGTH=395 /DNA_ID=CAMNT_0042757639 /DNA_START=210 /DNA_END=1398 /DNA_ORIENTATION=+
MAMVYTNGTPLERDEREGSNKTHRDEDEEDEFGAEMKDNQGVFEDRTVGLGAPMKRRRQRFRVGFASPVVKSHHLVPALCDIPRWIREEMFWGLEDYAAIRDNQRRLIEVVMRQVREYPQGVVPPPIPGESRRGLGIICEPGTNSGRAARVRGARRAIVEAYRDGYSPEMISKLAAELSLWATKNAYQVGLKDHDAVVPGVVGIGDFDLESFRHQQGGSLQRANSTAASSTSTSPRSPTGMMNKPRPKLIARASRRDSEDDDETLVPPLQQKVQTMQPTAPIQIVQARPVQQQETSVVSTQAPPTTTNSDVLDSSMGLASMIRCDSLNDLANHGNTSSNIDEPSSTHKEKHDHENDGLGLASMIRTDSLGNLAALDTSQSSSQQSSSDPRAVVAF